MANRDLKVIRPGESRHHVVGRFWRGYSYKHDKTMSYYCDSWVENAGYWLVNVEDITDRKNISERAISRTYHEVHQNWDQHLYELAFKAFEANIADKLHTLDPFQGL